MVGAETETKQRAGAGIACYKVLLATYTNTLEIQYKYIRNTIQIQKKCSTNTKQRAGQVLLAAASHRYIVVDLCTFISYVFVIYRRFPFINYIVLYIFCHICI